MVNNILTSARIPYRNLTFGELTGVEAVETRLKSIEKGEYRPEYARLVEDVKFLLKLMNVHKPEDIKMQQAVAPEKELSDD